MRVAIVGAGIAGLACAERLQAAGAAVTLFDKGRAPGGRMSTRRASTAAGDVSFDHGAQYMTARDPAFRDQVAQWQALGLAAPWPAAGPECWVGTPGMNAPVKAMANGLDVRWQVRVAGLARTDGLWHAEGATFDTQVVAIPAEQAAPILSPWDTAFAAIADRTHSAPCWTVMAAFADRLPISADIVQDDDGPMAWAARNSAKPGRSGPEGWVVQAGPNWSRAHLGSQPAEVVAELLGGLQAKAGIPLPDPLTATAHRWLYARSGRAGTDTLWNADLRLGVCGDWLIAPRVEAAWLSGRRLAASILSS